MLLLLCLVAVTQLAGATVVDISKCQVAYFGKLSTSVQVSTNGMNQSICFLETGSTDPGGDCIRFSGVSVSVSVSDTSPCSLSVMSSESSATITPSGNVTTLKFLASYQAKEFKIFVGVKLMETVDYDGSEISLDLTGCRHQGEMIQKGEKTCELSRIVSCNATGEIVEVEQCPVGHKCNQHPQLKSTQCLWSAQCALVGPAVVDFAGAVGLVPDLCSYTLLETENLTVVAEFRDRRRTDMGFPHRIILTTDNNTFIVGPGLQFQVDGSPLNLSQEVTVMGSVIIGYTKLQLSVLLNGVTNWKIVMDGTNVLITANGQLPERHQGLCRNISDAERFKDQEQSPDSCDTVQTQPPDSSINCTAQAERCTSLLPNGFIPNCDDSLPLHQPFYEACSQTLCKYPDKDELYCHFLNSFALMCKQAEADKYRTMAQCSLNQCADTVCGDSEFCELAASKEPRCRCRAGVYQDFQQRETTCQNQQGSVSIPLCVLTEKGLNVTDLHLNQESCRGTVDSKKEEITFSFDSSAQCGTQQREQEDKITYHNTVQFNSHAASGLISRKSSFKMDFSCFYSQPELETIHLKIKGGDGLKAAVQGSWPYNITVSMFSDINLKNPTDLKDGLKMNQMIYISMVTEGMDGALLLLKADNCYATDGKSKYSLISGGCGNPKDNSIKLFPANDNRGTVMQLKMFQFKGGNGKMFLKCKMKLCLSTSPGCKPNCDSTKPGNAGNGNGKKRRSVDTLEIDQDDTGYIVVPL